MTFQLFPRSPLSGTTDGGAINRVRWEQRCPKGETNPKNCYWVRVVS